MNNPASPFWRAVFVAAALMNLSVGVGLLFFSGALLPLLDMAAPENPLFARLAGGLIAVFGIGYAIVARDPGKHRDIVLLGAIGKAPVPLMIWNGVAAGHASQSMFTLSFGDLAFAALFAVFLLRTRPA